MHNEKAPQTQKPNYLARRAKLLGGIVGVGTTLALLTGSGEKSEAIQDPLKSNKAPVAINVSEESNTESIPVHVIAKEGDTIESMSAEVSELTGIPKEEVEDGLFAIPTPDTPGFTKDANDHLVQVGEIHQFNVEPEHLTPNGEVPYPGLQNPPTNNSK